MRIEDLRAGLLAFEALPENPLGARRALVDVCARYELQRAARALTEAPAETAGPARGTIPFAARLL